MKPTLLARQRVISASLRARPGPDRARSPRPGGPVEAGDQVQERRLARARGAHQRQELAFADREVEVRPAPGCGTRRGGIPCRRRAARSRTSSAIDASTFPVRRPAAPLLGDPDDLVVVQRLDRIEDDRLAVLQARLDPRQVVGRGRDLDRPLPQRRRPSSMTQT